MAVDKLRSLTVGTAVAGFVATGAFGTLAAFYYSGTTNVDAASQSGSQDANGLPSVPSYQNSAGSNSGSAVTPNSGTNSQPYQIVQVPTTRHHTHVSSGGSGGG